MKTSFKTVQFYENVAAGLRARLFCERLVRVLDLTLEEQIWSFDVLGIREVRNAAASAARKADVVIVSLSNRGVLPDTIRAWLDLWLWLIQDEHPALVALFDSSETEKIGSIRTDLRAIARRGGIDFCPYEMTYGFNTRTGHGASRTMCSASQPNANRANKLY